MRTSKLPFAVAALLGAFLFAPQDMRMRAQATTARVVGIITDASGAAVPNASVVATNTATSQEFKTSSNPLGNYELVLPVGSYTLDVESKGFQKTQVTRFNLSVDQEARVDVKLQVGQITQQVQVEATGIGLQTEEATVGTVIDSKQVVELPLNGRSFVQLALLTPGVNPGTPGSITVRRNRGAVGQQVAMSANGSRDTQNRFYYDGIESMDLDSYNFAFSPSIDAIHEFKVETSTYSAEMGGSPGGQVNLTTKSGTNSLHGAAWEFNRNDALTTLSPFQPYSPKAVPPRLNRNQFGANLGGPVYLPKIYNGKQKTFFFFNWESGRLISGSFTGTAFVPPVPYRTGDFSGSSVTVYDPETGLPFPGNKIPQDRIRPFASKFMQFVPVPNASEAAINFRGPQAPAPINQDQYISRIDHRISEKNFLYGSYMYNVQADRAGTAGSVPVFVWDTRSNRARGQNLSLGDTHTFSANVVNEARIGWNRFFEHEFFGTTDDPALDIGNIIGIVGLSKRSRDYGAPSFSAGYDFPATRTNGPRDRLNQLWQVSDNVSIQKGKHSLRMGMMVGRRNWTFDEAVNPRGTFSFDGRTTTLNGAAGVRENTFAAFLLGLGTSATISADPFATRMGNYWQGYFFQDNWRVTPSLTLNLGMRYEYFSPPDQRGKITNFDLNGVVPGFVPSQQIYHGFDNIQDTAGYPASLVFPDRRNWGPRFGFAFRAPGASDLVLRGGYGIYYTPEITNTYTGLTLNPPIVGSYSATATYNAPFAVDTVFANPTKGASAFSASIADPHLRSTYTQQWNFTIQKKLPGNVIVDVGYIGSKGTRLTEGFDGNRPIQVVVPGPGVPSVSSRRPFKGFDSLPVYKSIGNSNYHALQTKVERRVGRGLSVLGAYTFSKSLSSADISSVGGGAFLGGIQDYFNLAADKAPSGFDIRHRLSVAALYDIPLFTSASMPLVRTLLGGWQLGTIVTEQTGFGSAMGGSGDTTGTGIGSRLTVVPGQSVNVSDPNRDKWFNTAAFMDTPLGQWGNNARMPIHLPGLNNVDASATKNFRFGERANVQFRAEFFNSFNHVNLGAPGTDLHAPNTFGRITSASQGAGVATDGRVIQLGLKLQY
ncbi:MAG TPA: TonB-dependent receptor [Bryobacteraceae bacterium]|nr:TonB-dependent receptor [Bryobacteraceae bacterium]